jgi:hypothetical protein
MSLKMEVDVATRWFGWAGEAGRGGQGITVNLGYVSVREFLFLLDT